MQLFYRQMGKGVPLLILHGLFGLSDNWVSMGRRFVRDFRVIIPDIRNHGRSPRSSVFDFPSMEEDILELMEQEDIERAMVVGHSLGGRIAAHLALRFPEKFLKVVVVDISLRKELPRAEHMELIQAMKQVDLENIKTRSGAESALKTWVISERTRGLLLKNLYWIERDHLAWRLNLPVIGEQLPSLFETADVLGIYHGPALFIRGGQSDYIRAEDIPGIKKRFPGSIVRTIEGATHWVHADRPGEFYEMVRAFLIA